MARKGNKENAMHFRKQMSIMRFTVIKCVYKLLTKRNRAERN